MGDNLETASDGLESRARVPRVYCCTCRGKQAPYLEKFCYHQCSILCENVILPTFLENELSP